jgi:heme/copper-type cytochrome/quinol oxidase subunit 2
MPIEIKVVSKEAFAKWLVTAKVEFAAAEPAKTVPTKTAIKVAVVREN